MKIDEFVERNNRLGIKKYYPGERCTVYLICDKEGEIIYIGSTNNIDAKLSTHKKRKDFDETIKYYFDCPKDKYINKEKELIRRIKPKFNISGKKTKKKRKWERFYLDIKIIKTKMKKLGWDIVRIAKEMGRCKDDIHYAFSSGHCGPITLNQLSEALGFNEDEIQRKNK